MLIDLIRTDNYVSFNVQLAHIVGLHAAIYLSELLNINSKAEKKNKISNKYFTLDRQYISERTTFSELEQLEIEKSLLKIGVLEKSDPNSNQMFVNINMLTSLVTCVDDCLIDNVKDLMKTKVKTERKTKRDAACQNMKNYIVATNPELREAYNNWIDSVYANPKGFLSAKAVSLFQKAIDTFADHNLDVALSVINIAIVGGYRDAEWAINKYKQNMTSLSIQHPSQISSGETKQPRITRIGTEAF